MLVVITSAIRLEHSRKKQLYCSDERKFLVFKRLLQTVSAAQERTRRSILSRSLVNNESHNVTRPYYEDRVLGNNRVSTTTGAEGIYDFVSM